MTEKKPRKRRDAPWAGPDSEIGKAVESYSAGTLGAYREQPGLVLEAANIEQAIIEGGYGHRQLFELIQNGADELQERSGRVQIVLTEDCLYCANEGEPLSVAGVEAILSSFSSPKKEGQIGRYGLGFKSVLAVTTTPQIYSRSGSVGFDPESAAERIRAIVPKAKRTPILRVANALDPTSAAGDDPILAELMKWATTVVRLPRNTRDNSWLSDDMVSFPSQFLVFSPHVSELILEDRSRGKTRTIRSQEVDGEVVLHDDGTETRWRVFTAQHKPSPAAREDAGSMADRSVIPVVWAVPTRAASLGEFWAFFPTSDKTTLSGIVNAPWKLTGDRSMMLEGPFNEELLKRIALLVLEHLEVLCAPDDPGVLLELLTARGREARSWGDEQLTGYVNDLARDARSIPDQNGRLVKPSQISLHPAGIPRQVLELWSKQPTRPSDWAHPTVEGTIRRARVEAYMEPREAETLATWLEALAPDNSPVEGCIAACTVAAALLRFQPELRSEVREARIFMDEKGSLVPADDLFLRSHHDIAVEVEYVHGDLAKALDKDQREALGLAEVEPQRLLEVLLRRLGAKPDDRAWEEFWQLVRECEAADTVRTIKEVVADPLTLRARALDGKFMPMRVLLLPDALVDEDSEADARCVLDVRYHAAELPVIQLLGVPTGPTAEGGSRREPWFVQYKHAALDGYMELIAESGAAPKTELLDFETRPFAGPLTPLQFLSQPSGAHYTTAVLRRADDLEPWIFSHTSQSRYPEMPVDNPAVYMLKTRGVLSTQLGLKKVAETVGPGLAEFASILPVAEDIEPDHARVLGLADSMDALGEENWRSAFEQVLEADDDGVIGRFYAAAASLDIPSPEEIRCRAGSVHTTRPPREVAVSEDGDLLSVLARTGEPYIRAATAEDRDLLVERWGLVDAGSTVRSEINSTPSGEPQALADRFPMLRPRLSAEQSNLLLQPCSEIRTERFTEHGRIGEPAELAVAGDTVYHLGDLDDPRLLRLLDAKLSLGLDDAQIQAILRNREARRVRDLRKQIKKAADDQDRLLLAIGVEELRAHLPTATLDAVTAYEGELDDRALAGLALIVHGPRVLQEHSDALEQAGLEPPRQWAGGRNAVAFVRDLGFGAEFAGFESRGYERQEEVDGPPELGDLHGFQRIVVQEMRETLRDKVANRGLLSLPTGAGKTRVTIEAMVDAIAEGELESPILWVAQTEELCEQAIEAWSELWRGKGPRERLTISRLRANFEAEEAEYGHQVVVATIAKLDATNGVFTKSGYDWLRGASCIVVDEAHRSVGTSYRRLLDWQGIGTNRVRNKPLIGLTATPFRGTNEAETKQLVARYGNRRLDLNALGGADAYPELQRIGILSEVDHDLLDGIEIELTSSELKEMKSSPFRQLPDAALRKLAADVNRNRTLVDHIGEQPEDWPILLFAVSVNHAHTMAALLNRLGISAAAISSDTDKGARRHYIERFRRNKIRVLANYDVLTAGFDAPSVRAVYIARPVYAPNTYQQMIGRGLRGPKNGGTERCLLVNLEDNVVRFEETLAFHEFEYLWTPETAVAS